MIVAQRVRVGSTGCSRAVGSPFGPWVMPPVEPAAFESGVVFDTLRRCGHETAKQKIRQKYLAQ
jgi:hypothetical protein